MTRRRRPEERKYAVRRAGRRVWNVRLSPDELRELRARAKAEGISASEYVRRRALADLPAPDREGR